MSKRILSIDDNPANRKIIFDLLTNQGYEIIEAVDGREGLKKAKDLKPDLILMDIQLPEMDGFEVLKLVRAGRETKNIPVIILSSYAMPGDAEKGLAAGCNAYLPKPYNLKELLETIRKLIP
ncbi:MAG: response regulator [Candidatus Saganbacteria bacterium]|nr:response regulator [Candidatus Saganbacteria bacterium]